MTDQLERLRALARDPRGGEVSPAVREYLRTLTAEQLAAVEQFCDLIELGSPLASERLSDAEAVEEWRRLCRRGER
jgi:hypothetical protein